ncbi:uncharacterized protein LOC123507367 isoform X2 [Portunus trituberculatus]|uniref:Uncharacterized protein n=1 Tax=Portunus trituberculatus TaxID=210409 RepID=A0A5B7DIX4_PORTR|nr:uncharacterized protein LOC123507367 isoform X2 [Portunus trituberculatus]MPC21482.1 hypothetical protein [Portunus trituberculatus]
MRASGAVFLLTAALTGFTQAAWLENFSHDLIDVMSGVHGEQLPDCVLVQMGLVVDGRVNQAGLYLALANTVISNNFNQQNTFLDAISTCPAPSKPQLASFGACVIQACVSAL